MIAVVTTSCVIPGSAVGAVLNTGMVAKEVTVIVEIELETCVTVVLP